MPNSTVFLFRVRDLKIFFLFFLFNYSVKQAYSQQLPVLPSNPKPVNPVKKEPVKKQIQTPKTQTLRFTSNVEAVLYIDDEWHGTLLPGNELKVPLKKGSYQFRIVSTENSGDAVNEDYTVTETGGETLYSFDLKSIINKRLIAEANARQKALQEQQEKKRIADSLAGILPNMIFIQGGDFRVGNYDGAADEKPVHKVKISNFYMSKYEVTVAEFKKFIDATGYRTTADVKGYSYWMIGEKTTKYSGVNWSNGTYGGKLSDEEMRTQPVINISFDDAEAYCNWLSKKTGKTYRLPTEAEWEYAARGGVNSKDYTYSGSNSIDEVAFYYKNSNSGIHAVGQKKPNELGLFDMTGNVAEWCSDWYSKNYYSLSPVQNPGGPFSGKTRVIRGGSWHSSLNDCGVTGRSSEEPDYRTYALGFRVACQL